MTPVQRLDYSRPPLGYLVHDLNDDGWWWRVDEPEDGCTSPYETEAETVAAAWAHYKAHNDPPGLSASEGIDIDDDWHGADLPWVVSYDPRLSSDPDVQQALRELSLSNVFWVECTGALFGTEERARAAAWAWYDRRLAIAAGFDAIGSDPWPWPECLSWSDKQASTAELHLGSALPPDGEPTRG